VFEAALGAIEVTLRTDRAAVLIFDHVNVMRFKAWRGLSDDYRAAVDGHSPWSPDTNAPQPVLVGDIETDASVERYRPLFRNEGIGALAFFPILSRGKLLGKLMVYHRARHEYSEHEVDVASSIGAHLGSIVSRFAATERLQETVRYNELFAGVLAHDLRNPLAAVVTAAHLMQMRFGDADERSAKPVARILSSGQRMGRMIDQLLDVTRARAGGGIEVRPHSMSLAEVCEQAAEELELAHRGWSIRCVFDGDPVGTWDHDRLAQVLSNLIANAGQHGRHDAEILVTVHGRRADAVAIEIHNEGAIPADLLPTLFDPFRGSIIRRADGRGLGLGLFIVHEIVRAHEGTIVVDSAEERGTTFTVTLPRR
jgi:signal transduction histidine kinase